MRLLVGCHCSQQSRHCWSQQWSFIASLCSAAAAHPLPQSLSKAPKAHHGLHGRQLSLGFRLLTLGCWWIGRLEEGERYADWDVDGDGGRGETRMTESRGRRACQRWVVAQRSIGMQDMNTCLPSSFLVFFLSSFQVHSTLRIVIGPRSSTD